MPVTSLNSQRRNVTERNRPAVSTVRLLAPRMYLACVAPIVLITAALGALSVLINNAHDTEAGALIYELLWVGEEANVPTFVNFALLATASALMAYVARSGFTPHALDPWRWHWLGFAAVLLLFSFDEAAQVHEPVGAYLTRGIEGQGFFLWTWVIAGMGVVVVLAAVGCRFLCALPPATRRLVLLACAIYFGGALGLEMVSAYLYDSGMEHVRVVTLVEETCEMAGAALFGAAALQQLRET